MNFVRFAVCKLYGMGHRVWSGSMSRGRNITSKALEGLVFWDNGKENGNYRNYRGYIV